MADSQSVDVVGSATLGELVGLNVFESNDWLGHDATMPISTVALFPWNPTMSSENQYSNKFRLLLSSWPIPMLCPIMWAIVPAKRCGSYVLMSTLMPTALAVQTVSGTDMPASPPEKLSPLHDERKSLIEVPASPLPKKLTSEAAWCPSQP